MNKIVIKYFKAYKEEVTINLNEKNLLLHGENGSGKSSLYEAIKIIFFKDKLESLIPSVIIPEDVQSNKKEFWNQYKNNQSSEDFEIKINEDSYSDFNSSNFQIFMITMDKFCIQDKINLNTLLNNFDLDISDIETLCTTKYELIQNDVNEKLKYFKEENIKIVIDNEDDFSIKVEDSIRELDYKNNLNNYFNEAKLNLIILLLIFESISHSEEVDKKRILVLDDFITSLDMANRTFLMQYIFDKFKDYQKIILTHNVYFYNLIMYLVNEIYRNKSNWLFANLYEINNKHKIYFKGELTVKKIKDTYNSNPSDISSIGNDIRKKFEQLLHELSKLFMIGAIEDNKKIIENIEKGKATYWKKRTSAREKDKTSTNLLNEIEDILSSAQLKENIESKINDYKLTDLSNFKTIIKELKLYQKVTMHPMSHSSNGLSAFTTKEIKQSLLLLEKLENNIKALVGSDVDGA